MVNYLLLLITLLCGNLNASEIETKYLKPYDPEFNRYTELHKLARTGKLDLLKERLSEGLNPHVREFWGNTLLHSAAHSGSIPLAQYLLNIGLKIDAKDLRGNTVFHIAARNGHYRLFSFLEKLQPQLAQELNNNAENPKTILAQFKRAVRS